MKNWILVLYILLVGGFLFTACTNRDLKVCHIGVSQCSDDEWRHKMNTEMLFIPPFSLAFIKELHKSIDREKVISMLRYPPFPEWVIRLSAT